MIAARLCIAISCLLASVCVSHKARAEQLHVAVASNFKTTAQELAQIFKSGNRHLAVTISSAASGQLAAQIINGAPYDIFLSADQQTAKMLYDRGLGHGAPRTYAVGQLVFLSQNLAAEALGGALPLDGKIAVANPKLAPYGRATLQYLKSIEAEADTKPKLVFANNVTQAFAFFQSGATTGAFVAKSQVISNDKKALDIPYIDLPAGRYQPIRQDAIQLSDRTLTKDFMDFLMSKPARQLILERGYLLPEYEAQP